MPLITWDESFNIGVETINDQHKKLIGLLNGLFEIVKDIKQADKIEKIISELDDYIKYHFSFEEKCFKDFEYPEKDKHAQMHKIYIEKIEEFKQKFKENKIFLSYEIMDFLEDWILGHIKTEDKKYAACFLEHGMK
jgi:hemerythrin